MDTEQAPETGRPGAIPRQVGSRIVRSSGKNIPESGCEIKHQFVSDSARKPFPAYDRSPLSTGGQPAPIKRLVARNGCVWLFEVTHGLDTYYQVERANLVWRFRSLHWATTRFIRTSGKLEGKPAGATDLEETRRLLYV